MGLDWRDFPGYFDVEVIPFTNYFGREKWYDFMAVFFPCARRVCRLHHFPFFGWYKLICVLNHLNMYRWSNIALLTGVDTLKFLRHAKETAQAQTHQYHLWLRPAKIPQKEAAPWFAPRWPGFADDLGDFVHWKKTLLVECRDWDCLFWRFHINKSKPRVEVNPPDLIQNLMWSSFWTWWENPKKSKAYPFPIRIFWNTQGSAMFGYFQLAGQSQKQPGML